MIKVCKANFNRGINIKGGAAIDAAGLRFVFNRSLPVNDFENAQTISTLIGAGVLSTYTALTQVGFVKDIDEEIKRIEAERAENAARAAAYIFPADEGGGSAS